MERATLASVAIHVFAALLIPAMAWTVAGNSDVETISFTHVLRIMIVKPKPVVAPPRAAAPHHSVTPTLTVAHRIAAIKVAAAQHAPTKVPLATSLPAAPAVAAVTKTGAATANGNAVPAPSPSPIRAVANVDARQAGGFLPFGAEQPVPVLDPAVLKQLSAIGTHVTLIVTVGDDGHTTNIVFQPPIDAQTETRIRTLLADANWDPAVCGGGVACEGQATIKL